MYAICVSLCGLNNFLNKKIKNNFAKTFIAVPVYNLAKGGGKFFHTQFSQVDILY